MTREELRDYVDMQRSLNNIPYHVYSALIDGIDTLEQEPCEDAISRKSIKQKLQEHHDFFVNAYGGFSNLPQNDKSRVDEITNCIAMVVNEPSVIPQEPQTFKWCTDCREYNQEKHCCPRWSKVIRNTVEEMKQEYIEREVLDKIRAEIEKEIIPRNSDQYDHEAMWQNCGLRMALKVIDKYKAESEG